MARYKIRFTEDALADLAWLSMKAVTVSARSRTLNDLLSKARKANVLLRSESGEQFILAKVSSVQSFYVGESDNFDEEIKMTRANKKLMRFLDKRGEQAKKRELIPIAEVEKRLGLKRNRR